MNTEKFSRDLLDHSAVDRARAFTAGRLTADGGRLDAVIDAPVSIITHIMIHWQDFFCTKKVINDRGEIDVFINIFHG